MTGADSLIVATLTRVLEELVDRRAHPRLQQFADEDAGLARAIVIVNELRNRAKRAGGE